MQSCLQILGKIFTYVGVFVGLLPTLALCFAYSLTVVCVHSNVLSETIRLQDNMHNGIITLDYHSLHHRNPLT